MLSTRCMAVRWSRAVFCAVGIAMVSAGWAAQSAGSGDAERARWLELRREIARHDELYFRKGTPEISDHEYDVLKRELKVLDARFGDETAKDVGAGPANVGDDRTGEFPTVRHRVPMGSLVKVHSDEEVAAFHARVASKLGRDDVVYRVEPKYDGLAASLTYERGRLVRVVTRGNGAEGDDVTANARARVRNLLEQLAGDPRGWPEVVELRGEIFMREAEFARLNAERLAEGEPGFANPRNLAVGTLRSRDPDEVAGRSLELVYFGWGAWEGEGVAARPEWLGAFRAALTTWGLPVVADARVATGKSGLIEAVAALRGAGASDKAGAFPTDGVVVKLESIADQSALGEGSAGPRWAVARKFEPERAATRLLGVTWQVGRRGVLTPVAELAPVELGGSTVARATLHNADEIKRRDLRVGDLVWVEKAGEIIPAIVGVDVAARNGDDAEPEPCGVPTACPSCAKALERDADASGPRCANAACPARVARRLAHYVSRAALDIPGVGPALLDAMVARGLASSPAGLHRLTIAEWQTLPGVGAKKAEQLSAAFAAARVRAKSDGSGLVFALGLPGVGRETARKLSQRFSGLTELGRADPAALRAAGLGESAAQAVANFLADPRVKQDWSDLIAVGVGERWSASAGAPAGEGIFSGQSIVLTGTLSRWTRAEVTTLLKEAGAEVAPGITRTTTLLVAGAEPGAKLEEARRRGIRVINEAELARALGLQ